MKIEEIAIERGYTITEDGSVFNPKKRKVGAVHKDGYIRINIRVNKKTVYFTAHRLQAFKKYGNKIFDKSIVTRHLNGNKLDNSFKNIVIGTNSENMMDIPKEIRVKKALHASSFLKKYKDKEVVDFYNSCKSYKITMSKFNISSKGTLNYILKKNLKNDEK